MSQAAQFAATFSGSGGSGGGGGGEPWKTVTEAQLRSWTGNFCGPVVPSITPRCPQDPVTYIYCTNTKGRTAYGLTNGVLFSTHFLNYTEAQQDDILASYEGTHFPFNCTDDPTGWGYSGIFPPCPSDDAKLLNAALKKIWRAGKIPVCIVIGYHDQNTDAGMQRFVALLDDPLLCRIVVPCMEMNDAMTRPEIAALIQRVSRYLPQSLIYIEFTPGHGAGDSPEPEWWSDGWTADQEFMDREGNVYTHGYDWPGYVNVPGATGFLFNDNNFDNDAKMEEDVENFLVRLQKGGFWGMPRTIDTILFETVAVPRFWDNRSIASCDAHNQYVLDRCYHQDYVYRGVTARLAGYNNGGK